VLFIDEIHRLSAPVEEFIYPAMEDFKVDFTVDSGMHAKTINFPLKRFTLIGATTRAGLLSAPLRGRFGMLHHLEFYNVDELTGILKRSANLLELKSDNGTLEMVAGRSRGTPRVANRLLKRVRDYAQVKGSGILTTEIVENALKMEQIDHLGLDELDRNFLRALVKVYDGGPADKAGLRRGDLVTAIDGREVFDEKGLKFLAAIRNPGDKAQLNVLRGGKTQVIGVKVEPPPGATEADIVLLEGQDVFNGARVVELSPRLAEENGLDPFQKGSGIYVYSVSRRSVAGNYFRPGDIIRSINGKPTKTVKELKSVLGSSGKSWDIELDRNGRTIRGTVRL